MTWHPFHHRSDHEILLEIEEKVETLMASVESIEALLATLKTDLEAKAAEAKAEFAKLEAEVAAGQPANLEPLATIIEGIDAKVKAAVVPTD